MATEKRLIEQLLELANVTPPVCQYDKPEKTMIFGKEITVYCKPFEQFQELLRRAADALSVDAVEVVHGRWENFGEHRRKDLRCSICGNRADQFVGGTEDWYCLWEPNYCPNCGAKMDGDGND